MRSFKSRAVRQFRHNTDNSPSIRAPAQGFVCAYDIDVTDAEIERLQAEADLAHQLIAQLNVVLRRCGYTIERNGTG